MPHQLVQRLSDQLRNIVLEQSPQICLGRENFQESIHRRNRVVHIQTRLVQAHRTKRGRNRRDDLGRKGNVLLYREQESLRQLELLQDGQRGRFVVDKRRHDVCGQAEDVGSEGFGVGEHLKQVRRESAVDEVAEPIRRSRCLHHVEHEFEQRPQQRQAFVGCLGD